MASWTARSGARSKPGSPATRRCASGWRSLPQPPPWCGSPLTTSCTNRSRSGCSRRRAARRRPPARARASCPSSRAARRRRRCRRGAGYFKLYQSAGDSGLIDVPATQDTRAALQKISQNLPAEVRLPNLKPWGLTFRGARLVVVGGRPAAQLVYTSTNKAIGDLNLIIGSSKQPDIPPTFARRQQVNLLYWRHQGRSYVLAGQADIGYLWGIANDIAWQLDAI